MFRAGTPVEQSAHTVSSEILTPVGRNLQAELEILNAEKQEAESVIASVGAEIADAREEVEESKKHC